MRVESLTVLHYGKSYLRYALKSVLDHVDRAHVVYSARPSHGHWTDDPCPDTRQDLLDAVAGLPRVVWHDVNFRYEGQHRDYALSQTNGELALVVDADEVWDGDVLDAFLKFAWDNGSRNTLVGCKTLWRSFNWLCEDPMQPVRAIRKKGAGSDTAAFPLDAGWFWHFGYAIRNEVMAYKMKCHGHKYEWREGWFGEKWSRWPPPDDVHPTCVDTWHPQRFDRELLPEIMRGHPFYNLDRID